MRKKDVHDARMRSGTTSVMLFGGTDVTLAVAEAVKETGANIAGIVTLERSYKISYSSGPITSSRYADVAAWCAGQGVPSVTFTNYEDVLARVELKGVAVGLVAGWYHLVPRSIRQKFKYGCIGFHASLLPKLRGGAPLNWAILSGSRQTGVSMFELGDGVDDGPLYGQERFSVGPRTRISELIECAQLASASLVRRCLPAILSGTLRPRAQTGTPTYGLQRGPEDGRIDWRQGAPQIDRLVRAVGRPYPGAHSDLSGQRIQIWDTNVLRRPPQVFGNPGQITRLPSIDGPCVVTGDGLLRIVEATDAAGANAIGTLMRSINQRFGS